MHTIFMIQYLITQSLFFVTSGYLVLRTRHIVSLEREGWWVLTYIQEIRNRDQQY